jgi:hypothetical protein
MEQRFHAIAVRSAWGSASTDSGAAKAHCRRSSYSTPYCPPQALQHLRHQQRELALLDEITVPKPVYEAMTLFDGDGPIDPTVRRIRRTPPRAEGSPAPPHVYRQQLYLHPEEMQVDHSYTWTRSNEGTEVTVSATRSRESAAAAIRIAHVGPPRGLVACSVELLCLAFILISFSVRLALRRAPQRRVSGAQWSRRSCRRSVAYLPMSSAEMCGISLSGPALTASTSARNASVGAAAPRIGLSGLRKASNRGRTEC